MTSNSSIEISSELDNITKVFEWLDNTLFKFISNKNKISTLSLLIQEALVNAIVHGNKQNTNKKVTFSYELDKSFVHLKFLDEGAGVPLHNQQKNQSSINEENLFEDSGRGIILMKHFCKDVIFNKNSIELIVEV